MAISHADHDHPNTPAARAACRKAMADKNITAAVAKHTGASMALDLRGGGIKPAKMVVVPRTKGDGGVVKGLKGTTPKAAAGNLKKSGSRLRTVADLGDVPRMLAYGARLAWAADYEVIVGEKFNDAESRIVIKATAGEIAMVWRPSLPDGVWGVFFRPWDSSITTRCDSVQVAFELGSGDLVL
jgi:hypothetical protein